MATPFALQPRPGASNDELLTQFLDWVASRNLQLYPAQEEAILELLEGRNVILNTPTGSGKSLVAAALHFIGLARGRRSVYTCPIKALVNEKFLALCREFGPDNVGMSTGDATVNAGAPIVCCTAEVLANMALRGGRATPVQDVVMDEFHYYSDRERGVAWQAPLLTLPQTRFLLISATLGDTSFFARELTHLNGLETAVVKSASRPVPLEFTYVETALDALVQDLAAAGRAPVYIVHFTQNDAAQTAQDLLSINFCTREEKERIAAALVGARFSSPFGKEIRKLLRHGIGLHHAGLLPKYRVLVEQLAQRGLLKMICGTDTLGVGVNVPIRTVLFTQLCKFDGEKTAILTARDFHQIAGRAGRKGFDNIGYVVVQAPAHVIENLKIEQKGKKNAVKRRPPEKNFVAWNKATFERLIQAPPEPLVSRFQVSHAMLLNVLSRPGDGCADMQSIIQRCHDSANARKQHRTRAWQLFRSLVDRRIIEIAGPGQPGPKLRLNVELPDDFSLNHTLSLYLLDTLKLLDPERPDYALVLLTLVESILENPEIILRRQLDKLKDQKMAEMKQAGMDYLERMDELDKLEYPKPEREFIYSTFNAFSATHPWVGQENIRPKSIAREMFESFRSFADYINDYGLQRVEGLLLRHLSSVYKVLTQTVPESAWNDTVREIEVYLDVMIRQTDSSLLDEWEKLKDPTHVSREEVLKPEAERLQQSRDITRDPRRFTSLARAEIFQFLGALVSGDPDTALELLDAPGWTPERFVERLDAYHAGHGRILLDPEARNLRHTYVKQNPDRWQIEQVLVDPDALNDWAAVFEVDVPKSRESNRVHLAFVDLRPVAPM